MYRNRFIALLTGISLLAISVVGAIPPTAIAAAAPAKAAEPVISVPTPPSPTKADRQTTGKTGLKGYPGASATAKVKSALSGGVSPLSLTYLYAGANQSSLTETSVVANVGVANPTLSAGDFHTLGEVAVTSADQQQVVEVGWTRDPNTFADSKPRLFVYHWVNGVPTCYNGCGWVAYSGASIAVGADLTSAVGTEKSFGIIYSGGNWWVLYNGGYIGYFPGTLWTSPTFTTINQVKLFGEVAANSAAPCTDMGNGNLASSASATRFYATTYSSGSGGVNLSTFNTNPSYYSAALVSPSVRTFRWGGPGAC
jgi:hypothetical protein